jgi:hypothetical protein
MGIVGARSIFGPCIPENVRRRRRAGDMCMCRRRQNNLCINDVVDMDAPPSPRRRQR